MILLKFCIAILAPLHFVWLFTHFEPSVNFWILVALSGISLPLNVVYASTLMPLYMRLYPKEKFGQFCSFMAICHATVGVVAGLVGGVYIDWMRRLFPDATFGQDFCYRLMPSWRLFFVSIGLILLALLYREWRRLGGEKYVAHGPEATPCDDVKCDAR